MSTDPLSGGRQSWFEASARQRIAALADAGRFVEFVGPECREVSPHLPTFDLPCQFDDGMVVGAAHVDGTPVYLAAQEGRFLGGSFGEVHGAKLTGLLRAARALKRDVVIAFDTGGVRLQEANAGELAIAEVMRALTDARAAGVRVLGLVGGRAGCYGGGGLLAGCCSRLVVSEQGRISVSGPEVIETNQGVEEFDARDRALVWRTMGGKHRYLLGGADVYVHDDARAFRAAVCTALAQASHFDQETLAAEQRRLERRLTQYGGCSDGREVWAQMGVAAAAEVPDMEHEPFLALSALHREDADDAR